MISRAALLTCVVNKDGFLSLMHSHGQPLCSGGNISFTPFMLTLLTFKNQYCWVGTTKNLLNSHQTFSLVRGRGLGTRQLITWTNLFNNYEQWQGSRKQEVSRPLSDDWKWWWKNFFSLCCFSAVSQLLVWRCLGTECHQCHTVFVKKKILLGEVLFACWFMGKWVAGMMLHACLMPSCFLEPNMAVQ